MKPKFKIGQWVRVEAKTHFYIRHDSSTGDLFRRQMRVGLTDPVEGVIVGATYKFCGKYHPGDHESNGYIDPSESYLVWKVAIGYLNKPIFAMAEGIVPIDGVGKSIPWKDCDNKRQSIEMKGIYKRNPEWFKRDEKGRFR
jgi:hypothetical protein